MQSKKEKMKERRERWLSSEFTWTQQCNLLLFSLAAVVQSYSSISYQKSQANTYFHLSEQSKHTLESATLGPVFILINVIFLSVSLHYYTVLITELGLVCREAEVKVLVSDRSVLEPHCGPQTLQKHQKQQWQVSICRPEGPVYGPGVASVLLELNSKLVKKQSDASFCGEGEPVTLHSPWTRVFGNCVFVWS